MWSEPTVTETVCSQREDEHSQLIYIQRVTTDGRTGGQTDRQVDRRTGGQTDRWTDRQVEDCSNRYSELEHMRAQNFGNTSGWRSSGSWKIRQTSCWWCHSVDWGGGAWRGHMACFWIPGMNSLALGFRLLFIWWREEENDDLTPSYNNNNNNSDVFDVLWRERRSNCGRNTETCWIENVYKAHLKFVFPSSSLILLYCLSIDLSILSAS